MNQIKKFEAASVCLDVLRAEGVSVEQTTSPMRATQMIAEVEKSYLTPYLDPANNDFTEGNHFWMALKKKDRCVMVGGARCDELGREPVSDFWRRTLMRGYKQGDIEPVQNFSPLCDRLISGRVVYMGDMYAVPEFRGSPTRLRCFLALAHLSAISKWSPDILYAFMREGDIDRGADRTYGFLNAIPNFQTWEYKVPHRASEEWCVFNRLDEFSAAVQYLVSRVRRDGSLAVRTEG